MAWNPFKAIGDAIGRVFSREEEPGRAPQPERPQEPQERGFFGRIIDRVTGAERAEQREPSERERQLEERERQLAEREERLNQQLAERERQLEERERAMAAPPEPELPKFGTGPSDFLDRDERAFGADSEIVSSLEEAVADFISDRGGLDGLSVDATEWLETPTVSAIFDEYWVSGGFTADQVVEGMTTISNVTITEGEDGSIHVEFDYESEVDGEDGDYVVSGHASS